MFIQACEGKTKLSYLFVINIIAKRKNKNKTFKHIWSSKQLWKEVKEKP